MDILLFALSALPSSRELMPALGAIVLGSFVQSSIGLGFGMVAAPILMLINPILVPAPTLLMGMFTCLIAVWRDWSFIEWREVGVGSVARFFGAVTAFFILIDLTDNKQFILVFGVLVLISVLLMLSGLSMRFSMRNLVLMSWFSGVTGTISSVGGPQMAIVYQNKKGRATRATLSAFFLFGAFVSCVALFAAGRLNLAHVLITLLFMPCIFIGSWLAKRTENYTLTHLRICMIMLAALASILLIFRGLS